MLTLCSRRAVPCALRFFPRRLAPGALAALLLVPAPWAAENSTRPALSGAVDSTALTLRWTTQANATTQARLEVLGVKAAELRRLQESKRTPAQWQELLAVYVESADALSAVDLPPMLGRYSVQGSTLSFAPEFPLQPGLKYRGVFRPAQLPGGQLTDLPLSTVFECPSVPAVSTTVVAAIYPSADLLPENLLKFYLHFSAPMSGGHIYEHIHLRNAAGQAIELPFLEIDEELWNSDMTRLTLFIDPGRIKRGVRPLEEVGPALEAGQRYQLVIDRGWKDSQGQPLKASFEKSFRVGEPDRAPPDPARWKIESPRARTRQPLVIDFGESLDHALALRVLRVLESSGGETEGIASLENSERRWKFIPRKTWQEGAHRLIVQTKIEDLAGNNIGKAFEVDLFEGVQRRLTNTTVTVAFEIR